MALTITLKRSSSEHKRPQPGALSFGEVAVNDADLYPGVFFKNASGTSLVKVGPVQVSSTAPNQTPPLGGFSGNSLGETWYDTRDNTFKVYTGGGWAQSQFTPSPVSFPLQGLVNPICSWSMRQVNTNPSSYNVGAFVASQYSESLQILPPFTNPLRTNDYLLAIDAGSTSTSMTKWFSQSEDLRTLAGQGGIFDTSGNVAGQGPATVGLSYGPQFTTLSNSPFRTLRTPDFIGFGAAFWCIVQFGGWNAVSDGYLLEFTGAAFLPTNGSVHVKREAATNSVKFYRNNAIGNTALTDALVMNSGLGAKNTLLIHDPGNGVDPVKAWLNGTTDSGFVNLGGNYTIGNITIGGPATVDNAKNWGVNNPIITVAYWVGSRFDSPTWGNLVAAAQQLDAQI